jgi:hypothetical protein
MNHSGNVAYPPAGTPDIRPQQSFRCEQCHLRIVRDGAKAAVGWNKIPYSPGTELAVDFPEIHELHGCAKGIAYCATEQTAAIPDGSHSVYFKIGSACGQSGNSFLAEHVFFLCRCL